MNIYWEENFDWEFAASKLDPGRASYLIGPNLVQQTRWTLKSPLAKLPADVRHAGSARGHHSPSPFTPILHINYSNRPGAVSLLLGSAFYSF